jgi:hypothetical protein
MFQSSDYWNQIARYDTMSDNDKQYYISKTRQILYWLNADRFYWKSGDLESLAEAFFAMGNVVSFCRICFLSPIISFIGPLQVNTKNREFEILCLERVFNQTNRDTNRFFGGM